MPVWASKYISKIKIKTKINQNSGEYEKCIEQ